MLACLGRRLRGALTGVCLLLCLLSLAPAFAQTPDWVVNSWQTEAGLPLNAVTCLLQTRDGYLWVGTANGLARFDGVRFTSYRVADGVGLRSNRILCLLEDANGTLWIGTDEGGLTSFNNGQFTTFTTADGLSSDKVLCLGEDQEGTLWAGTDSGLNRRMEGHFTTYFKTDGLPDDRVPALCQPRRAPVLFATGNGFCEFHPGLLVPVETALPPGAQTNLTCLVAETQNAWWAGSDNGLFRLQGRGTEAQAVGPLVGSRIGALLARNRGGLWFGADSGAVGRVNPNGRGWEAEALWHATRPVTALCEDHEGNLWVGTAGDGLYRLKQRQVQLLAVPKAEGTSWAACLYEAAGDQLQWVARDNLRYRRDGGQFVALTNLALPDGVVAHTVCQAREGELWIGTLRDGLFRSTPGGFQQFSERDGLSDSAIEALYADPQGGLWIGTRNGGLNHFNGRTFTRFNTPWGFYGAFAGVLEPDPEGGLWIGTTGEGLYHFKDGRFTPLGRDPGLPSGQIHDLIADPDGALWVATAKGLCLVRDGKVTSFAGSGLVEEAIYQLHSSRDGSLWVGANNRLFRVRKEQLKAIAEGRARFVDLVPYGSEDGLAGLQCVPRIQSCGPRKGQGGLWFATTKGLVIIEQDPAATNDAPPNVVLEAVFVENQNLPFNDRVVVAPGKESLRFEFTALSLTAPGKVNFRYQLEGFDRDFSEPGTARSARYPKIAPGHYRFRVIACNHDGVWNQTGASVAVVVRPFWWATLWFRGGVVLAVVAALAGLVRLRQARLLEIERLRVRIASDLHDDLGTSLWSITLLSRMLTKHGQLGDEERQDIGEIHRIAIQSSNSIRDIIWLINPAFDTLQELLLRTKDFAGTVLRGTAYRMHCELPDLARKLPFDFRHNLFLFFKEALTNIARHAQATEVEVRLEENGGHWQLSIRDNGQGFDPAVRTGGNGLRNLQIRAGRMGARLEITSQPGRGTTLILTTVPP